MWQTGDLPDYNPSVIMKGRTECRSSHAVPVVTRSIRLRWPALVAAPPTRRKVSAGSSAMRGILRFNLSLFWFFSAMAAGTSGATWFPSSSNSSPNPNPSSLSPGIRQRPDDNLRSRYPRHAVSRRRVFCAVYRCPGALKEHPVACFGRFQTDPAELAIAVILHQNSRWSVPSLAVRRISCEMR